MIETISLRGLPESQARLIYEFTKFLKFKMEKQKYRQPEKKKKNQITFATWSLGVKGKLTRDEIYDYL